MKKKLNLSYYPHIRPICLPQNDREDYVGRNVITTGWGLRQPDGHSTKELREVDLHVISNDACQENHDSQITDQMICAIGEAGTRKDACKGDSGESMNPFIYYYVHHISRGAFDSKEKRRKKV